MGKGSGKRATRERAKDVSAAARDEAEQLARATARRLAKLKKDLAAARKTEERHRSRLAAASAEADRIRIEIGELVRHASEPAVGGVKKVGHAASDLLEDAADVVTDAAGAVRDAAGSVVGVARRAVRSKRATAKAPAPAKPAAPRTRRARPATPPATGPDNG
jgi:chromosome segregation ATPase